MIYNMDNCYYCNQPKADMALDFLGQWHPVAKVIHTTCLVKLLAESRWFGKNAYRADDAPLPATKPPKEFPMSDEETIYLIEHGQLVELLEYETGDLSSTHFPLSRLKDIAREEIRKWVDYLDALDAATT